MEVKGSNDVVDILGSTEYKYIAMVVPKRTEKKKNNVISNGRKCGDVCGLTDTSPIKHDIFCLKIVKTP